MTFRRQSLLVALAVVPSLLLAGCGSSDVTLSSIVITPSPVRLAVGGTTQLSLTGTYSDSTRSPITSGATFSSSAASVATVNSSGTVTAIGSGTATVTASASGQTADVTVTVSAGLVSIAVLPSTFYLPNLPKGATQQLSVIGTFSDGSTINLTAESTFVSTAPGCATVTAAGLVTAVASGNTTIVATHRSGKVATAAGNVGPPLTSIAITPSPVNLEVGAQQSVTVTGTYEGGTTQVLTSGWTLALSGVNPLGAVTVSGTAVTGVAIGTATLVATETASGKVSPPVTVNVTAQPLTVDSIALTPSPVNLVVTQTQGMTVTATMSNGTTQVLPSGWTLALSGVNPPGAVTVAGAVVTAVIPGTATLTATDTASGKISPPVTVTVSPPTLVSIALTPSPVNLPAGTNQTMTVTGTYDIGPTKNLTADSTLALTNVTPADAVTVAGAVVTGVTAGTAKLTATHTSGKVSPPVDVTVTSGVTLTSITVAPSPVTLPIVTGTATLVVTGHYSDSTTATIPNANATFLSNAASVATVSTAGVVLAGVAGKTTVTVTASPAPPLDVPVEIYDPVSPYVFYDDFAPSVFFSPFDGSTNNLVRDPSVPFNGRASLKVVGPAGGYTGGAMVAAPHDLRAFNAITFWAKSSAPATVSFEKLGFGDTANAATGPLLVELHGISMTTSFQEYFFPIPNPAVLAAMQGLFFFADGANHGVTFWFNDIRYVKLLPADLAAKFGAVTNVSVNWPSPTLAQNDTFQMDFNPNTAFYTVGPTLYRVGWNYFTLSTDTPGVATVDKNGLITGGATAGTAHITATYGDAASPVAGNATVTGTGAPLAVPPDIAQPPTLVQSGAGCPGGPDCSVISLFSSAYNPYTTATPGRPWEAGITWQTNWSTCCNDITNPYLIGTHNVIKYKLRHFVGIEFGTSNPPPAVDATNMTSLHVDVWSPNPPGKLQILLINDNNGTIPGAKIVGVYDAVGIATNQWVSLDIPLTSFNPPLTSRSLLNQMQLIALDAGGATTSSVVYVDNMYFH